MIDVNRDRIAAVTRTAALLVIVSAASAVTACTGLAIGAGATAGVAAYEERSIDVLARDTKIATLIRTKYFEKDHTMPAWIGVEVYEGRALLTGAVNDEARRVDAVSLAWQVEDVKEVINEVQLASTGIVDFARDSWITTQLKSRLVLDKQIHAINYSVETVNGIVYLIGIARDQAELDRVMAYARDVDYVRRVRSHVRVKGAPS